jgi:predicted aspartyl protease
MPQYLVTNDRPILEVIVSNNGSPGEKYKFLIDTGGTTHITPRVIEKLLLTPGDRVLSTSSTNSEEKVQYSIVVEIPSLGSWPVAALSFEPMFEIDGLLGGEIVRNLIFHWDGPAGWFSLDRRS